MIKYLLVMAIAPSYYVSVGNQCLKTFETKAALELALKEQWFPGCIVETAKVYETKEVPLKFTFKKVAPVDEVQLLDKVELK